VKRVTPPDQYRTDERSMPCKGGYGARGQLFSALSSGSVSPVARFKPP
jgi:hypothetical protein